MEPTPTILTYAPVQPAEHPRVIQTIRVLLFAGWAICVAGTAAIASDVRSVLVSGPVLCCAGLLILVLALIGGHRRAVVVGSLHLGICALFVGAVLVLNLGPAKAQTPFLIAAVIYTAGIALPTKWAWAGPVRHRALA